MSETRSRDFPTGVASVVDTTWHMISPHNRNGKCGGEIKMVCHLIPVEIGGRRITKATIMGGETPRYPGIGPGCHLEIALEGNHPRPRRVLRPATETVPPPSHCPGCFCAMDGFRCPNPNCRIKILAQCKRWMRTFKVRGIGSVTLRRLVERDYLYSIADLYRVTPAMVVEGAPVGRAWRLNHPRILAALRQLPRLVSFRQFLLGYAGPVTPYYDPILQSVEGCLDPEVLSRLKERYPSSGGLVQFLSVRKKTIEDLLSVGVTVLPHVEEKEKV